MSEWMVRAEIVQRRGRGSASERALSFARIHNGEGGCLEVAQRLGVCDASYRALYCHL